MGRCDVLCRAEVYCGDVVMLFVFLLEWKKVKCLNRRGVFGQAR